MAGIKDIFTKQTSTVSQHLTDEPITRHQSISELNALIHNCIAKIQRIEQTTKDQESTIQEHEKRLETITRKYDRLQHNFEKNCPRTNVKSDKS